MTAKLKKKNEKLNQEVTASIKYRLELYDYIYIYMERGKTHFHVKTLFLFTR